MKKEFDKIIEQLKKLSDETSQLKALVAKQNEEIEGLKKQLNAVSMVTIEEDGKQSTESYANLILDEIVSIKNKLEGFSTEGLRGVVNDVASLKNKLEEKFDGALENHEFSLTDLKSELLKLADMMSV